MDISVTDSSTSTTIGYVAMPVLIKAARRGYGWTIKPDKRRKHPASVKPKYEFVIKLNEAPASGVCVVVQYTSTFEA